MYVISLCTPGALDSAARRRSTAALDVLVNSSHSQMRTGRRLAVGLLLLLASQSAEAHGEEVVFFLGGQLVAFVAVGVIAWRSSRRWAQRIAVFVIPVLLALPLWYIPRSVFPEALRYTVLGNLLTGLLPPIALAVLATFVFRMFPRGSR